MTGEKWGVWLALAFLLVAAALGWRFVVMPALAPTLPHAAQRIEVGKPRAVPSRLAPAERRIAEHAPLEMPLAPSLEPHAEPQAKRMADAPVRPRRHLPPVTGASRSSRGTLTYRDEDAPRPSIRIDGLSDDGWVRGRAADGHAIEPYGPDRSRAAGRVRGPWRAATCWDGAQLAPCLVPRWAEPRSSERTHRRAALSWRGSAREEEE